MSKTASSVVVTDKFKKELENFFEWASVCGYKIKDINDESHEWSMKLMTKFEEPGRNKLEVYIRGLFAKYTISLNECDIEDAKLLSKEFKEKFEKNKKSKVVCEEEEKPKKKSSKKVVSEEEEKPKKKSSKKVVCEEEKPKKKLSKKATSDVEVKVEEKESVEGNIKVDMTLDTSETYNIDTLEFWTEELIEVFGEPKKTGKSGDEHTWEWKIEVNGDAYTIYDWNENGELFEESTWYLGGMSENKKNIKELNKYIESVCKEEKREEQVKKRSKKEKVEKVEEVEEVEDVEVDYKELFGDDDDEEIELDLDDIEDE